MPDRTDAPARTSLRLIEPRAGSRAGLRPVPLDAVTLQDAFWRPRRVQNARTTLPSQYDHCESTGRLANFDRAAGTAEGPFEGIYYNDSDVYKWLEGAAWTLGTDADPAIERLVADVVARIRAAQDEDGYLDTYFQLNPGEERWGNLADKHELYLAGHLMQAAVAHHRATGSRELLDVAVRLADHVCDTFGSGGGRRPGAPGHQEIEMALVELGRETGDERYLEQARYFVGARGQGLAGGDPYHQDHLPYEQQDVMVGHAVRMIYMAAGATDVYTETGGDGLRRAIDAQWRNMTERRMYVTGGVGSRYQGEAFGRDFELPDARAYAESCAAIGSVMWNQRLLHLDGDARYADLMETTMFNAVLPGISLDGKAYFYQNPLADDGTHRREPWFGCACCPPNLARFLATVPGYLASTRDDALAIHLYAAGEIATDVGGESVEVRVETRYPWDGHVRITHAKDARAALELRIPGWVREPVPVERSDGARVEARPGGYLRLEGPWRAGDEVTFELPMPVRRIASHPHLVEHDGRVAFARGPILYCVEGADLGELHPLDLRVDDGPVEQDWEPELLGGVVTLALPVREARPRTDAPLYAEAGANAFGTTDGAGRTVRAVPYYAWANRESGAMEVWLRTR